MLSFSKPCLSVFLILLVGAAAAAEVGDRSTARELAEIARQRAKQTKVEFTLPGRAEDEAKLKALADTARNRGLEEMQRQSEAYRAARPAMQIPNPATAAADPTRVLSGTLIVALSSSMPDRMIRDYLVQLDGLKGSVVVLRGFLGGATKVAPTGIWLEKLTRKDPSRREEGYYRVDYKIDPLVYRDLRIKHVPAIAYLPNVSDLKHCDSETLKATAVVYGASSVAGSLRELKKQGVDVPEDVIRKLEGVS